MTSVYLIIVLLVLALLGLALSMRILTQYERGVQFRLGRVKPIRRCCRLSPTGRQAMPSEVEAGSP